MDFFGFLGACVVVYFILKVIVAIGQAIEDKKREKLNREWIEPLPGLYEEDESGNLIRVDDPEMLKSGYLVKKKKIQK